MDENKSKEKKFTLAKANRLAYIASLIMFLLLCLGIMGNFAYPVVFQPSTPTPSMCEDNCLGLFFAFGFLNMVNKDPSYYYTSTSLPPELRPTPTETPPFFNAEYLYTIQEVEVRACSSYVLRACDTTASDLPAGTRIDVERFHYQQGSKLYWWVAFYVDDERFWIPVSAVSDTVP